MTLTWMRKRHNNAATYRPHRPESSFKGPVNAALFHYFKPEKHWMIVPEILLRDVVATKDHDPVPDAPFNETNDEFDDEDDEDNQIDPRDDGDDDDDIGDLSFDSQGGEVQGDRGSGLRPDFGVAKATSELFSDRNHLYVEVKNGKEVKEYYAAQLFSYVEAIASAIPADFPYPYVVLMLVDAGQTYVWHITSTTHYTERNIWKKVIKKGRTHGRMMHNVLKELAGRD